MSLWLVRAGRGGERDDFALDNNVAVLGWDALPDLSGVQSRKDVEAMINSALPEAKPQAVISWAVQVWAFVGKISVGDYVVLPLKNRPMIAFGRVGGPYKYEPENPDGARHTRPVTWINQEIPRTAVDQDILFSLGAFSTVCQISRNDAERKLLAIAEGKAPLIPPSGDEGIQALEDSREARDLASDSNDAIRKYVAQKFKGHDLARLVDAVLKAQGYFTYMSPPGADGGVDILAGRGELGMDAPRLCVQVKSSDSPTDVKTIRELDGVMNRFSATHGLFVSWGGFRRDVNAENRREFFRIRLWDSDDLITAITNSYDQLSADIQAELPLQRIWALVTESTD